MPFPLPSVRIAQASPSLSLEKGAYRMRAPPARLSPSSSSSSSSAATPLAALLAPSRRPTAHASADGGGKRPVLEPASYEKRMAALVALLACAALASFGAAWWVWTDAHARGLTVPASRLR